MVRTVRRGGEPGEHAERGGVRHDQRGDEHADQIPRVRVGQGRYPRQRRGTLVYQHALGRGCAFDSCLTRTSRDALLYY